MKVVEMTGLSYPAVRAVIDLFDAGGWAAIRPACRGRSKGDGRVLSEVQEQAIQSIIIRNRPEQLKMDFCLWSRAAVGQLISQEYGIDTGQLAGPSQQACQGLGSRTQREN